YAKMIYNGLWYSPLKAALDAFIKSSQERVSGVVRIKFLKGNATIVGRKSVNSLYDEDLATYTSADRFDHKAAEGFIYVWGMPTRVWSQKMRG
ncbi:MAG: argininosuccinate synthase, partial [Pseudanabaena sp. RU_4_16]|nr:argininosuccinate synthase [Pseudanabaena sp. RU_4_16]